MISTQKEFMICGHEETTEDRLARLFTRANKRFAGTALMNEFFCHFYGAVEGSASFGEFRILCITTSKHLNELLLKNMAKKYQVLL